MCHLVGGTYCTSNYTKSLTTKINELHTVHKATPVLFVLQKSMSVKLHLFRDTFSVCLEAKLAIHLNEFENNIFVRMGNPSHLLLSSS